MARYVGLPIQPLPNADYLVALGSYLTSSESQTADVECFSSEDDTTPLDDSAADCMSHLKYYIPLLTPLLPVHTEQYQAMYHVLMAFALINAILGMSSCFPVYSYVLTIVQCSSLP